jgi:hypothetical protein
MWSSGSYKCMSPLVSICNLSNQANSLVWVMGYVSALACGVTRRLSVIDLRINLQIDLSF